MLNIFLQSALTLPIMCYLMCSMLELRWPLRKSVAVWASSRFAMWRWPAAA